MPTLGPPIISPIVEHVRSAMAEDATADCLIPYAAMLSKAVIQIGRQYPEDAADWGQRMLEDPCEAIRQAGLYVLKHFPNAAVLDRLWEMNKVSYGQLQQKEAEHWWQDHEYTFDAMVSSVHLNPDWLERRIRESPEGTEPFSELAYLVANLRGTAGSAIWAPRKTILIARVPPGSPRCLVTCIEQHADGSEVSWLESWLDIEEDATREFVFSSTLVYLAPERALTSLNRFDTGTLYVTRSWWLPGLLLRFPDETRNQIRGIIRASSQERWRAALVYQYNPNQMDAPTLALLLEELEILAHEAMAPSQEGNAKSLWHCLQLPAKMPRVGSVVGV